MATDRQTLETTANLAVTFLSLLAQQKCIYRISTYFDLQDKIKMNGRKGFYNK
jgi:hypothetical protein